MYLQYPQWPQEGVRSPESKVSCFALPCKSISLGLPCPPGYLTWVLSVPREARCSLYWSVSPKANGGHNSDHLGIGVTGGGELSLGPLQEEPVLPNHCLSESAAVPLLFLQQPSCPAHHA